MDRRTFLKAVGTTALLLSLPKPASGLVVDGDPPSRMVQYTFPCDPAKYDEGVIAFFRDDGDGKLTAMSPEEWHKIFREGGLR